MSYMFNCIGKEFLWEKTEILNVQIAGLGAKDLLGQTGKSIVQTVIIKNGASIRGIESRLNHFNLCFEIKVVVSK